MIGICFYCVRCCFFVIICEIYDQFLSEYHFKANPNPIFFQCIARFQKTAQVVLTSVTVVVPLYNTVTLINIS